MGIVLGEYLRITICEKHKPIITSNKTDLEIIIRGNLSLGNKNKITEVYHIKTASTYLDEIT